jgi:hypothetical protein
MLFLPGLARFLLGEGGVKKQNIEEAGFDAALYMVWVMASSFSL